MAKKLFGTVRIAKLPIGFRFEKGDAASKLLGLSQGYIPNFAGLSDAIGREKTMSGLPASQIMAHFDGKDKQRHTVTHRDPERHRETHRDSQRHTETHRDAKTHKPLS